MLMGYESYTESHDEGHKYHFKCVCKCGDEEVITVNGEDLFKYNQGGYIQDSFPYLNTDQRERLMSGLCIPCYERLWGA